MGSIIGGVIGIFLYWSYKYVFAEKQHSQKESRLLKEENQPEELEEQIAEMKQGQSEREAEFQKDEVKKTSGYVKQLLNE